MIHGTGLLATEKLMKMLFSQYSLLTNKFHAMKQFIKKNTNKQIPALLALLFVLLFVGSAQQLYAQYPPEGYGWYFETPTQNGVTGIKYFLGTGKIEIADSVKNERDLDYIPPESKFVYYSQYPLYCHDNRNDTYSILDNTSVKKFLEKYSQVGTEGTISHSDPSVTVTYNSKENIHKITISLNLSYSATYTIYDIRIGKLEIQDRFHIPYMDYTICNKKGINTYETNPDFEDTEITYSAAVVWPETLEHYEITNSDNYYNTETYGINSLYQYGERWYNYPVTWLSDDNSITDTRYDTCTYRPESTIPASITQLYSPAAYFIPYFEADKFLSFKITRQDGTVFYSNSIGINKKINPTIPSTPVISSVTENSVTVEAMDNCEYAIGLAYNDVRNFYQTSNVLTQIYGNNLLSPNTEYQIYCRYADSDIYGPSFASQTAVTTDTGEGLSGIIAFTQDCEVPAAKLATVTLNESSISQPDDLDYEWRWFSDNTRITSSNIVSNKCTPERTNFYNKKVYVVVTSNAESGCIVSRAYEFSDFYATDNIPTEAPVLESEGPSIGELTLAMPTDVIQYLYIENDNTPPCADDYSWRGISAFTTTPNEFSGLSIGDTCYFYMRAKRYIDENNIHFAPTPASPALIYIVPKATLTITVVDDNDSPVAGAEVQIDGISATTDNNGEATISGLDKNLEISVTAAGFNSYSTTKTIYYYNDSLEISLTPRTFAVLTGAVSISGTLQFGEELIASVTGTNNSGTLSYQWKRNDSNIIDATSSTYTLVEADINTIISVSISSSVETGTISSNGTDAIEKADQATPSAPTLSSKTHNSITLSTVSGCEYAETMELDIVQESPVFSDLVANTGYDFKQRYAETNTYNASAWSEVLQVTTNYEPLTGTVSINGTLQYGQVLTANITGSNNTGTLSYQWKRDGSNINGATSTTYTTGEADIATTLAVVVTSSAETGNITGTTTAEIEKADRSAPSAPTLSDKTHNSITLNTVSSCEYAIDGGSWQSSPEFTGLNAETEYNFTQRYTEISTHKASSASTSLKVTTDEEPVNALTGTVSISGTLQYGQTLTTAVSGSNNTGIFSYQWKRNGSNISGATSATYTTAEADIATTITVVVTSSVETGSITGTSAAEIEKADRSAPAAPTLNSKSYNSITLNTVNGCEYFVVNTMVAVDPNNIPWQSSASFTGLSHETEYSCVQRYEETSTHKASPKSSSILVETDEEPVNALTGTVSINGTLQYEQTLTVNVTGSNNTGTFSYQWKRDGSNINGATSASYTTAESDIATMLTVVVTSSVETGSITGTSSSKIEKADRSAPASPTLNSKSYNSITLNTVSSCEYAIDGGSWQTSATFNSLQSETEYNLTQRYAETSTHKASSASNALKVTTDEEPLNALTGTVSISGTLQYGQTLTVNVTGSNNTGTFIYQWKRDGSNISGATSATYTTAEADIATMLTVVVTSSVETGSITRTTSSEIEKADHSAPASPTLNSKSYNSITLNTASGCQYAINSESWQNSATFNSLQSETEYTLTQRYAETNTHKASSASTSLKVTTEAEPVNALTGTVSINGTLQYGQTLTATVSGSNNTGTYSYQWKRDGSNINGATSEGYTTAETDIATMLTVVVTSSVETGSITGTASSEIEKADRSAPATPTLNSKSYNSITLNTVSGCQYAINSESWQNSATFNSLQSETEYNLTQRYAETSTHKASSASTSLKVTTEAEPVNALTGTVSIIGTLQYGQTLTATVSGSNNTGTFSYQWKRNGSDISGASSESYTLVETDISTNISVEINSTVETGSIFSTETVVIEKADQSAPPAIEIAEITYNSFSLIPVDGCEYRIDKGNWQSSAVFTELQSNTEFYSEQRYAETATHKASSSVTLQIQTKETLSNALTGTVIISGLLQYGETLTATVSESNNTGTLSYEWRRNSVAIPGATENSYTLTVDDIETTIIVVVSSSVEGGSIFSKETSSIGKAVQETPDAPTLMNSTDTTITLTETSGCEYALIPANTTIDMDNLTWQTNNVFTNLERNTEYLCYQRFAETATHYVSNISEALTVTTTNSVTSIANIIEKNVMVYPNPASSYVTVSGLNTGSEIKIYNTSGQLVIEKTAEASTETLDISQLRQGLYLLITENHIERIAVK